MPGQTSSIRDDFSKEMGNKNIDDREDAMPKIEDLRARMGSLKLHIQKVLLENTLSDGEISRFATVRHSEICKQHCIVQGQLLNAQDQLEVKG